MVKTLNMIVYTGKMETQAYQYHAFLYFKQFICSGLTQIKKEKFTPSSVWDILSYLKLTMENETALPFEGGLEGIIRIYLWLEIT